MTTSLTDELKLPCGATLPNRFAKSAMSENMASRKLPDKMIWNLYQRWGEGGIGLIITGNVMIDPGQLGEPGNIVLEEGTDLDPFRKWTATAQQHGCRLWAQINHPGRQAPRGLTAGGAPVAPSAIAVNLPGGLFVTPKALSDAEIKELITRYGNTARLCKEAGFHGVQIHGAHGYLVSQFLSPLTNVREDDWGGSAEKRRRFVVEVFKEMRRQVGPEFPIGIKLNSADFQRGGFSEDESVNVIKALEAEGLDLLEVSGGTYEKAAMAGAAHRESTLKREAYFLTFAEKLKKESKVPVLVTGGFRSLTAMEEAVTSGATDIVGMARPLAIEPYLVKELLAGHKTKSAAKRIVLGVDALDKAGFMEVGYYEIQMKRMGQGKMPDPKMSGWAAAMELFITNTNHIVKRLLRLAG